MLTIITILGTVILLLLLIEIAARIYFQKHYKIPFRSRMFGQYPYKGFIEMVDPPLHYRFRRGFRSPRVNIDRFGCRGAEPEPDGCRKRLLVIGESNILGVKLPSEKALWSARLKSLFRLRGLEDWEVINAGTPVYNSTQHLRYWEQEIARVKPDIVVIGFGFNDLSQAWMMGKRWDPETTVWPKEFIYALERRIPRLQHLLASSCAWLLWRRRSSERREFPRYDDDFQWERCLATIENNYLALRDLAAAHGARVAGSLAGFAFDSEVAPEDCRRLEGIQANWRSFHEGRGSYDLQLTEEIRKMFRQHEIPFIDLDEILRRHPRRYEFYLDIAHFNEDGMRFIARTIYAEIDKLGWWRQAPETGCSQP
jgi:lysophospholipase L1-like esterase